MESVASSPSVLPVKSNGFYKDVILCLVKFWRFDGLGTPGQPVWGDSPHSIDCIGVVGIEVVVAVLEIAPGKDYGVLSLPIRHTRGSLLHKMGMVQFYWPSGSKYLNKRDRP